MDRTLSIKIPEDVFQKLQRVADFSQRTIDDLIIKTVNATFVAPVDIPAPIANELAGMRQAKDESLWEALRPAVTVQQQQRLQELNSTAKQRPLTQIEIDEQQTLLIIHHRSVLRRAQAIAILSLRGHNVSDEQLQQTVL